MIQNSLIILLILIATETVVLFLSEKRQTKHLFAVVPAVFWIYFLPMVLSSARILPVENPVYDLIPRYLLPVALIFLLLGVDLAAILGLGRKALLMMLTGSTGIVLGAPIVLSLFKHWLPENAWMGFGALSGSWVGGSANMIAVKEAIGAPDSVFFPMIVVDVVVAYSWMGFLILAANYQERYDRWNRSDLKLLVELKATVTRERVIPERFNREFRSPLKACGDDKSSDRFVPIAMTLLVGLLGLGACLFISQFLPTTFGFSKNTWTILIASTLGLGLSFTPLRRLESFGASKIGYAILFLVLTAIGAKANLAAIAHAPILVIAGFVWVLIHVAILISVGRFVRAPLCLLATASQANIGGPVSAPIVASVYHSALAPVGLLLGIFGNIIGTYVGLFCSYLCKLVN